MLGASEKNEENKSTVIEIDMDDVRNHLDAREQKLFMALLQTIDGKKRVAEFSPPDYELSPEEELVGACSTCGVMPKKIICTEYADRIMILECDVCGKKVDGDPRAAHDLWQEWIRINNCPDQLAGPHVNTCDESQPDTVNRTATGEQDATHH